MSKKRVKKYQMVKIPDAISELGGYSARFIGDDGGTTDAYDEILPGTIEKTGLRTSTNVARAVTTQFFLDCIDYVAKTGETLVIPGVLMIRLSIRGSFKNKDSQAKTDNVHVSVFLLNEAKPKMVFSMSNANEGKTLMLYTATTPNSELNHVVQGETVDINGRYTKLLDGDKVSAAVKVSSTETVEAVCPVLSSDDSHIVAQLPSEFNAPALIGKEIVFTVEGRCGDPDAGTQTKKVTATLDEGDTPPPPTPPNVTKVATEGKDGIVKGQGYAAEGENLFWNEGCIATVRWTESGEAKSVEIVPAEATPTKFTFDAEAAFDDIPDGTELTFTFDFGGGATAEKKSVILAE
jgi:hypothetical protein